MRVALVSPAWPPAVSANGIVTYVGLLREGLSAIGVETRVLAWHVEGTEHDPDIIDLERCNSRFSLAEKVRERIVWRLRPDDFLAYQGARRIVEGIQYSGNSFPPDLVEMGETLGTARLVAKRTAVPVVLRLHGPWFLNGAALGVAQDAAFHHRVAIEGKAIATAKAVTSPSRDLLDRVRRRYGIELPHGEVIPNPAPVVAATERWTLTACDPDLVLFVGRFDRHKGGDLVVEAFSKVARQRPGLKLVFIGPDRGLDDGRGGTLGLQEYLSKHIPDLSVRSRIQHLGQMPAAEIPKWRRKARVTIVASRFEVFGIVTVEALAYGCPVVAATAGGIPEIVFHEENGLLFENGNAGDLAHWLETMLDQPELSATLGRRGAMDVKSRFAPDVIARQTKQYYERVNAD